MTNKQYITNVLMKFNLSETEIDLILIDNDLNENDQVDVIVAKTEIHKNLTTWLPVYSSIDEGNVSETWNHEAVLTYYSLLCKELGLDNLVSTNVSDVRDKSNLW